MSNLSEEEIITDAKQFVENIKKILNEGNNNLTEQQNIDFYTLQSVLQGLLDLYQAEKEKNKELEKKWTDLLSKYEMKRILFLRKDTKKEIISKYYISQDIIKEKINKLEKEIQFFKKENFIAETVKRMQQIEVLEELLKGE